MNPKELLVETQKMNTHKGSATMIVAVLEGDRLNTCYIGDSGLLIIRKYNDQYVSIYETTEQQHSFNFPFQLASVESGVSDDPQNAICASIHVQKEDIVVMGSDGLFDNIYNKEILASTKTAHLTNTHLTTLSRELAEEAIKRGKQPKFLSPFAFRANLEKLEFIGGKLDDTTVILADITD